MSATLKNDWFASGAQTGTCERCGSEGAVRIGDRKICRECYVIYGSCCMEFGADDLWREASCDDAEPRA